MTCLNCCIRTHVNNSFKHTQITNACFNPQSEFTDSHIKQQAISETPSQHPRYKERGRGERRYYSRKGIPYKTGRGIHPDNTHKKGFSTLTHGKRKPINHKVIISPSTGNFNKQATRAVANQTNPTNLSS